MQADGDYNCVCANLELASSLSSSSTSSTRSSPKVYVGYFAYGPRCGATRYGATEGWAEHGDELPFVFPAADGAPKCSFTTEERALATAMRSALGQFAATTHPVVHAAASAAPSALSSTLFTKVGWPVYDGDQEKQGSVLIISPKPGVVDGHKADDCGFWQTEYSNIQYGAGY
eukprot:UC1_evm1s714